MIILTLVRGIREKRPELMLFGSMGIAVVGPRIWEFTTGIPKEPMLFYTSGSNPSGESPLKQNKEQDARQDAQ